MPIRFRLVALVLLTASATPLNLPAQTTRPASTTTAPAEPPTFYSVYRLTDSEVVKFIPTPWVNDRIEHLRGVSNPELAERGQGIFYWTADGDREQWSFSSGAGTVASALGAVGLQSWEYEAKGPSDNRSLKYLPMPGDWLVRKDAPRDQLIPAVLKIIAKHHPELLIEPRRVEREYFLATGRFAPGPAFELYVTPGPRQSVAGGGTGTMHTFLEHIGNQLRRQIVDQTDSTDDQFHWVYDISFSVDNTPLPDVLRELSKQTGLQFKLGRKYQTIYTLQLKTP